MVIQYPYQLDASGSLIIPKFIHFFIFSVVRDRIQRTPIHMN